MLYSQPFFGCTSNTFGSHSTVATLEFQCCSVFRRLTNAVAISAFAALPPNPVFIFALIHWKCFLLFAFSHSLFLDECNVHGKSTTNPLLDFFLMQPLPLPLPLQIFVEQNKQNKYIYYIVEVTNGKAFSRLSWH